MFRRNYSHTTRVSTLLIAFLAAQAGFGGERWLELRMGGQPAGYVHEQAAAEAGAMVTEAETRIVLNRLGSKVEIQAKTRDEETGGCLSTTRSEISSSAQVTLIEGHVREGTLTLKISTGGKTYERSISIVEPLLGPEAARRLTLDRLTGPGTKASYNMFSPELGSVTTITRTWISRDADGLKIEESMTGMPAPATVWLDGEGRVTLRTQPGPMGDIELRSSSQSVALAAAAGAELPAEVYSKSLIRSNIRLPHPRRIEALRVRIHHNKPELGWPAFADEHQTVIEQSKETTILEIRRSPRAKPQPTPGVAYLAPNALFQSDDPAVLAIVRQLDHPDIYALRDWTAKNVHFDAGIAVAPASEVAKNRAGTCFGYAILLGSLARAEGIPSRLKMGFGYAGGIWGGHAWVELFQNGEWIPVDAALPSPERADAARISFFTSSLEEGTLAGMGTLAQMFGNVDIEILSFTEDEKAIEVPKGSRPYSVTSDLFEDPWLGVKLRKPAGYTFTKLDAVWPESTIVGLVGPQNEKVTLDRTSAEPKAEDNSKALLIMPDEDENWVLTVEAPNARAILKQIAAGLEFSAAPRSKARRTAAAGGSARGSSSTAPPER